MYANINDTRIFFDIEGMGCVPDGPIMRQKPICFILHGGPGGDHTSYKPALSPLADIMQLVYIDNRGSGLSARGPQSTYTLENNVADIEALRQYLGLDKIVLFAHSYGGKVAMTYATRYSQNLQGLLLLTTSPSYKYVEKAKQIVEERGTEEQKKMAKILWEGAFTSNEQLNDYYRIMGPLYSVSQAKNPVPKEESDHAQARANRSYEALNEGFKGFLRDFDIIDELPTITVPTLVMGGRHDWVTPVEASLKIAKSILDNELVIFEKSSHSVIKDEYDLFISTVKSFVKRKL